MSATTTEKPTTATDFASEVVTRTPVHDIDLPGGLGTLALITLDNGFDHTKPNTFGPQSIAGLTRHGRRACVPAPRPARSSPSP